MIRILQVVPNMQSGGLETFLMNVYKNIDRNKVQFDFLVHYKEEKFYDEEINALGGKIFRFSLRDNNNIFKYIKELDDFFRKHKEYKVIHCHMASIGFLVFWIAKRNGIKTRIAHSHDSSTENTFKGKIKRLLMQPYKYISTVNYACSKQAGKFLFGKKNFEIIPNGIEIEKFKFSADIRNKKRDELNLKEDEFLIGHVGRFSELKNHKFLIDVFYEVYKENRHAKLVMVGSGELEQKIKDKAKMLGISENTIFLENRKDVNELYQAFDCFAFPSKAEGLGIALVEAQVSGLNVICSKSIPQEVKISDNIDMLELDKEIWKMDILKKSQLKSRNSIDNRIFQYDIKYVSEFLMNEYIKYYKRENVV